MALPDPGPVLDLIEAFRRSKTMFAAVSMGVFDRLSAGPASAQQLRRPGEDPSAFDRFLDACVSLGLLEKHGGLYANSPVADAYLRDSPNTLTGYINYSNDVLWQIWAHLEDGIREGTNRWKQTFDLDGPLFSAYYSTEERKREFLLGMHGIGRISSPGIAAAFDLSRFHRVVDLGGATGHLPAAILERYPAIEAAVFDLPQVILHDWGDEKVRLLLARIYEALPKGGGLLIAERLLHDDLLGPVSTHMQSLNMLLATEGRERSFGQYAELLREAGFTGMESKPTGLPLDAVLALKG